MNSNLEIAIIAALKAGEAIMEVYSKDSFEIDIKSDNSPLTEADKISNDIINAFLEETSIPIISEENKEIAYPDRKDWSMCWVVDPIDGTKEFIKRNGEFTVNIALIKDQKPLLGVIYVPAVKELYFANVENGVAHKSILSSHTATINEVLEISNQIQPNRDFSDKLKVVGSRSHMNQETTEFIDTLKAEGNEVAIVSKGSSLKFCLVAEGIADVYPRYAPTMEWDTAAGQAICNAVGLTVISHETKEELLYNKENLLNPWFKVSYDGSF